MTGSEETRIGTQDYRKLPKLIQKVIPVLFDPYISPREMYAYGNAHKLHEFMKRQIRAGLNVDRLEALSFAQWLLKASYREYTDPALLKKVFKDTTKYTFDPEHRLYIKDDCQALSDMLISTVKRNAPRDSLLEASRVHFTRSASGDRGDTGSEQNMAVFRAGGAVTAYFLVDCAAYYFNPAWAKAWKSDSIETVLRKGTDWLTNGEGKQPWNIPQIPVRLI